MLLILVLFKNRKDICYFCGHLQLRCTQVKQAFSAVLKGLKWCIFKECEQKLSKKTNFSDSNLIVTYEAKKQQQKKTRLIWFMSNRRSSKIVWRKLFNICLPLCAPYCIRGKTSSFSIRGHQPSMNYPDPEGTGSTAHASASIWDNQYNTPSILL